MKPVPVPQPESQFYWDKLLQGELWLRRCDACAKVYFYPRDLCPGCFSRETSWMRSSGRGTLHSFAIVHRPPNPDWRDAVPYVVALVELEGSARLPTNLVGVEASPDKIHIGMAVEIVFRKLNEQVALPLFKPATE
ncbi:MAG: Zn-ribbon domain-containing OB-fold protein [Burkholderiaceae bacterium]|nr:Zn-ribbon domain-containing OB-fold protein [Burkholderiaceae bacterium]